MPSIADLIKAATPPKTVIPTRGGVLQRLLEDTGLTPEDLDERAIKADKPKAVPETAELRRIAALPRRMPEWSEDLASDLTKALKTPWGTQSLRPIQAAAIADLHTAQGLFAPINVGGGKTLITYLGPRAIDAQRPVLVTLGSLKEKTRIEFREYAKHWQGPDPDRYEIVSYSALGRVSHATKLAQIGCDLLCCDEAHKLKNAKAAVTRRVKRFILTTREAKLCLVVAALTGSVSNRSIKEYAHIIAWCLPSGCPVPMRDQDLDWWADALDERKNTFSRMAPGALSLLANDAERADIDLGEEPAKIAAQSAYRRRLVSTRGVVATQGGKLDVPLEIKALEPEGECPKIIDTFRTLRAEPGWVTPDFFPIPTPMEYARVARELALGFHYIWDPRPPDEWREARSLWYQACQHILRYNRRDLDTELQVAQAVDRGLYPLVTEILADWRRIKPTFEPNSVPVWHSDQATEAAIAWGQREKGLIWTCHRAVGFRISALTGWPYYANKGYAENGAFIMDHPAGHPAIVSIDSNSTGHNLQAHHKALVLGMRPNGREAEQMIGRMHRPGQSRPVEVWVYLSCLEHILAIEQASRDAWLQQRTTGQDQKLCYADLQIDSLDEYEERGGYLWTK